MDDSFLFTYNTVAIKWKEINCNYLLKFVIIHFGIRVFKVISTEIEKVGERRIF